MSWLDDLLSLVGDAAPGMGDFLGGAADWSNGLDVTDWGNISYNPDTGQFVDLATEAASGAGDFLGGAVDWSNGLNPSDWSQIAFDTDTGKFVDLGAEFGGIPDAVAGAGSGLVGDAPNGIPFTGSLDSSPTSPSTSDILRSVEGSVDETAPGREPFDPAAMADPSASIASAGEQAPDWQKLLAQGLKGLLGATAPAMAKLASPGLPGLVSTPSPETYRVPSVGATEGYGRAATAQSVLGSSAAPDSRGTSPLGVPGLTPSPSVDGGRLLAAPPPGAAGGWEGAPGLQSPVGAALAQLFAVPINRAAPFTPLAMTPPAAVAPPPMAVPRLSGLQALLAERRG